MGIDGKHDRLVDNVLRFTAHLVCKEVDGLLHLSEVRKLLVRHFFKLAPWCDVLRCVVQTKLQRSTRHHSISSGEKIKSDNGLENRTLSCRLGSQDAYPRQLNELLEPNIPEFIDDVDELPELLVHEASLIFLLVRHFRYK